MTKEMKILDKD